MATKERTVATKTTESLMSYSPGLETKEAAEAATEASVVIATSEAIMKTTVSRRNQIMNVHMLQKKKTMIALEARNM